MKITRRQMRQMIIEEMSQIAEANTGIGPKGRHWALSPMTGEKHWGGMAASGPALQGDPSHAIHYEPEEPGRGMSDRSGIVSALAAYFNVDAQQAEEMFRDLEREGQKRMMGLGARRRGGG